MQPIVDMVLTQKIRRTNPADFVAYSAFSTALINSHILAVEAMPRRSRLVWMSCISDVHECWL